jgi:hypothetical protein
VTKQLIPAAAAACMALTAISASPASAQDYYGRGNYSDGYSRDDAYRGGERYQYDRQDEYRGYHQQRRGQYRRAHRYGGYAYGPSSYDGGYQRPAYRQERRCHSGTTGAILGGVLGGLLGREIGRGGAYNEPSTTGLIIGAGGGALAGRAIERSRSC